MNKKVLILNDKKYNGRPAYLNSQAIVSAFGDRGYIEALDTYKYNAFLIGQIVDQDEILNIREFVADQKLDNQHSILFLDPSFAKDGKTLEFVSGDYIANYKKLVEISDVFSPNLSEACIISGESYEEYKDKYCTINYDKSDTEKSNELSRKIIESISPLLDKLRVKKNQITIITGIEMYNSVLTILDIFDGDHGKRQITCNYSDKIENRYGAAELFSSMFFETSTNGFSLVDSLSISTSFVFNSLRFSRDNKFNPDDGIIFEPILYDNIVALRNKLKENKNQNKANNQNSQNNNSNNKE